MLIAIALFHSFQWLSNVTLYICTKFSLSIPLFSEYLDCFHFLAIVDSTAMNIGVHVSFWIMFFSRYIPRNGTAGSYGRSVFI